MSGKLQGVQDQNLLKEKAVTLKRSISDPTLVKTKCVSGENNFFYIYQLFVYKKDINAEKTTDFNHASIVLWISDLADMLEVLGSNPAQGN